MPSLYCYSIGVSPTEYCTINLLRVFRNVLGKNIVVPIPIKNNILMRECYNGVDTILSTRNQIFSNQQIGSLCTSASFAKKNLDSLVMSCRPLLLVMDTLL